MKLADVSVSKEQLSFLGVLRLLFETIWLYYRWPFLALLGAGSVSGLFQLAAPKVFQSIIDRLVSNTIDVASAVWLAGLAGFSMLMGAMFKFFAEKVSFYVATQVEDRWRYTSLFRFYNLPMSWQDHHDSGEIGAKLDRGGSAIWSILHEIFGERLMVSLITLVQAADS
ncbi:ABC transporter ATP-binding protein [Candidatus Woesearchaeota archaeon]|nr:ABC transporter ATP-binding protein [Candidatus Woesearchaeota archaeon]